MSEQFTKLYFSILSDKNLSINAKVIYSLINSLSQDGSNHCWASNAYLAEITNLSASTVKRTLIELECNGYISRTRVLQNKKTTRNIYVKKDKVQVDPIGKVQDEPQKVKSKVQRDPIKSKARFTVTPSMVQDEPLIYNIINKREAINKEELINKGEAIDKEKGEMVLNNINGINTVKEENKEAYSYSAPQATLNELKEAEPVTEEEKKFMEEALNFKKNLEEVNQEAEAQSAYSNNKKFQQPKAEVEDEIKRVLYEEPDINYEDEEVNEFQDEVDSQASLWRNEPTHYDEFLNQ